MSEPTTFVAPGAYRVAEERWGRFEALAATLPQPCAVLLDRRVARLHPRVRKALRGRATAVLELTAGERVKSLRVLEKLSARLLSLPRSGTILAVGGGTVGDLATVAAHLHKRGVRLIHVPTTLLAAVDSSLGGKGAVHAGTGRAPVKNALGVFHYADACWLCPELFETLSPTQRREGRVEAWKMVATLSAPRWRQYVDQEPSLEQLVRDARALKAQVCAQDPYELGGERRVLNFGHTFGHVLESVTGFRLSHGDAVGLGMRCALDVGRALGVTPPGVAEEIEQALDVRVGVLPRTKLASALAGHHDSEVTTLLAADKKVDVPGEVRMVLVQRLGQAVFRSVAPPVWRPLARAWRRGIRP